MRSDQAWRVAREELSSAAEPRTGERQFHTLADAVPQLVWMADTGGRIFWFNTRWYDYTGLPAGDVSDWKSVVEPSSLTEACRRWQDASTTGAAMEMEVSLRGKDGTLRPFLSHIVPLRDPDGFVYRWIGTHVDISEQRRREEHMRFLADELSHRTKNLLAVVIAVSKQTAGSAGDAAQYHAKLAERLLALAESHDLLVRDKWQGASLADLIAAQMKPFGDVGAGRIYAAGPALMLRPDAVQNLGLALHELATNASKHGALSAPQGEVSVHWLLNSTRDRVLVQWRERGGPPVEHPQRRGFGHLVIERIVPKALGGKGALSFSPAGLTWTFEFPIMPAVDADLADDPAS
jgi:PAS domain S-box-containing protein